MTFVFLAQILNETQRMRQSIRDVQVAQSLAERAASRERERDRDRAHRRAQVRDHQTSAVPAEVRARLCTVQSTNKN